VVYLPKQLGKAAHPYLYQYENYLRLDWNPQVYKRYVPLVGSATAQQIVRKNNEAWRAFLGYCSAATATTYEKPAWICRVGYRFPSRAN